MSRNNFVLHSKNKSQKDSIKSYIFNVVEYERVL